MNIPGVSIVIISHNEEKNIADCLESVSSLDYPKEKLEVVVVDSSTDRTKDIVGLFANIRLIKSGTKGFAVKRNLGYISASHELIAFLDADCIAPRDWLLKMVPRVMNPGVAAVCGNAYPPPNAPFLGKLFACIGKPGGGAIGFDSEVKFLDQGINYIAVGGSIFKKRILEEIGGFNETLEFGNEDSEISERIRKAGYILEYVREAFVYHKTRNTLGQFTRWAFRRGLSHFYASNPSLGKVLFDPFSPIWLIIFALVVILIPFEYLILVIAVIVTLGAVILYELLLGRFRHSFPNGRKKLGLLIGRRRKIGVNMGTIILLIIPLFYLDRLIIGLAQVYCKILSYRRAITGIMVVFMRRIFDYPGN